MLPDGVLPNVAGRESPPDAGRAPANNRAARGVCGLQTNAECHREARRRRRERGDHRVLTDAPRQQSPAARVLQNDATRQRPRSRLPGRPLPQQSPQPAPPQHGVAARRKRRDCHRASWLRMRALSARPGRPGHSRPEKYRADRRTPVRRAQPHSHPRDRPTRRRPAERREARMQTHPGYGNATADPPAAPCMPLPGDPIPQGRHVRTPHCRLPRDRRHCRLGRHAGRSPEQTPRQGPGQAHGRGLTEAQRIVPAAARRRPRLQHRP